MLASNGARVGRFPELLELLKFTYNLLFFLISPNKLINYSRLVNNILGHANSSHMISYILLLLHS